ncbi:DUF1365 family protein, partial [Klebsiella pneumoniae]|uniref:DUF1365 family protein n=1 Tax=Klebsiella pneumoniae TaxID=573 RepID=UPI00273013ED
VHMADWQGAQKVFDATLSLQKETLNRASLHRYLWRFPWMTAKTCLAIYWQALRLLLKRTPIFPHRAADGDARIAVGYPKDRRHEN